MNIYVASSWRNELQPIADPDELRVWCRSWGDDIKGRAARAAAFFS